MRRPTPMSRPSLRAGRPPWPPWPPKNDEKMSPMPPKPPPNRSSKSTYPDPPPYPPPAAPGTVPKRSYCARLLGSERTSYASLSSLNWSSASAALFTSGCSSRARRRNAFLISASDASFDTPRISYRSLAISCLSQLLSSAARQNRTVHYDSPSAALAARTAWITFE